MRSLLHYGIPVLFVALGIVLAVLARDGACNLSLPAQCSYSFGVTSYICLALGILLAAGWLFAWQRRANHAH